VPHELAPDLLDPDLTLNPEQEAAQDAATIQILDLLLQKQNGKLQADWVLNPDDLLEEDDEEGQADAEADIGNVDVRAEGFVDYIDK